MNRLDWDDVCFFLAAARTGSLAAAARRLDSHQPTVGRRIDALEKRLGVRLFQRHAQGLTLTEEGRSILRTAEAMDEAAAALERAGKLGDHEDVRGGVRIAAPSGLAVHVLAPALPRLRERAPNLDVVLQPSVSSADLTHGEADIAVRLYRPAAGELVVRRAGAMGFGLYAAPAYLQRHGAPQSFSELAQHCFVGYGQDLRDLEESRWLDALSESARYALRSDDTHTRLAATAAGLGIAVLPHVLARTAPLARVLEAHEAPPKTIWLVVHQDLRHLARVRAAFDWLDDVFAASGLA